MDYLRFAFDTLVILGLTWVPGLLWNGLMQRRKLALAFLPLPGVTLLVVTGIVVWRIPESGVPIVRMTGAVVYVLAGAGVLVCAARRRYAPSRLDVVVSALAGLVMFQALLAGVTPLPVAQEMYAGTSNPGRMIASPPDHQVPYVSATYFVQHLDGRERVKEFFGEWALTSRGPLVPLAVTALFAYDDVDVTADGSPGAWPLSPQGHHLARIFGWQLNALVILAGAALLTRLGVGCPRLLLGLGWLALAPVTVINTVFLWPKLTATAFVLLSVERMLARRPAAAGAMMALAWLSHPVGALLIPPMALAMLWHSPSGHPRALFARVAPAAAAGLAVMAPWLLFKLHLHESDPFSTYLLGDGLGYHRATSVSDWLEARWLNVWLTLVPFAGYFHGVLITWIEGPLGEGLRLLTTYAKTLPGQLGYSFFLFAYAWLLRPGPDSASRLVRLLSVTAFIVMVIFWGYSADGLGRNSLEPVSVLLIVGAAAFGPGERLMRWALPVLAVEALTLEFGGFLLTEPRPESFLPGLPTAVLSILTVLAVVTLALTADRWASGPRDQLTKPLAAVRTAST